MSLEKASTFVQRGALYLTGKQREVELTLELCKQNWLIRSVLRKCEIKPVTETLVQITGAPSALEYLQKVI